MKETVNRFEEEIITTSNLSEMKDKYLAETLYRKWPENFVDESTGAKVMKIEAVIDHAFCHEYIVRPEEEESY